jgi:hypothetical protein
VTAPRALLIVCGVLSLVGCGASKSTETTTETQAAPTPPTVRAVDEPATVPPLGSTPAMCPDVPIPCQPTPAYAEKLQRAVKQASEPKVIAELRLPDRSPDARARLIAWHNPSGQLCLETQVESVNSDPFGPCAPGPPCQKLCLHLQQTKTTGEALYLLGGVVASANDRLQVTAEDGSVATYGLDGPIVPGFSGYRVFMLDLGRGLYRQVELLAHDQVVAKETLTPAQIRSLRCNEGPPVMPSQDRSAQPPKCIQRPGPK